MGRKASIILGSFAEFEVDIRRGQMKGIAKAKERGVYQGRKASIDPAEIRAALAGGESPTACARAAGDRQVERLSGRPGD